LSDVIRYDPDIIIIIGIGNPGLMEVPEETKRFVQSIGIELIVDNTKNACQIYNKLKENKEVIAALHLTC